MFTKNLKFSIVCANIQQLDSTWGTQMPTCISHIWNVIMMMIWIMGDAKTQIKFTSWLMVLHPLRKRHCQHKFQNHMLYRISCFICNIYVAIDAHHCCLVSVPFWSTTLFITSDRNLFDMNWNGSSYVHFSLNRHITST